MIYYIDTYSCSLFWNRDTLANALTLPSSKEEWCTAWHCDTFSLILLFSFEKSQVKICRKQKMGRNTWTCESCVQYFTSRYSENRHNRNLHDGKGIIISILDYIVGRLSGQFLSNGLVSVSTQKGIMRKINHYEAPIITIIISPGLRDRRQNE
ncbi:MAG: hypothetical protein WA220_03355 [Candidatus Nitrosopolaris sp.]